ncbi:lactate dehydrogenase [Suicoccus acidiformans]|uniref:Lactate dehydrogenase n=1 Tax=Suicoccus acidiformans TaxID=2036206 RepID=A0A347WNF4_9LACT|nr:D-2-hydroxyacid dehydrogenase [Suicoccus acidiformans]AXY26611.1 lactate dehydrogenase [Suicoccus acidiformans]
MEKILAYRTTEEEREFIEAWSKEHGVKVDMIPEPLLPETVHLAEGYDGVTTMQMDPIVDPVYERLESYGIHNIAQRSAGFDMYDLPSATNHGIVISNVPSYSPESIAEFAVFSALNLVRNRSLIQARVDEQNFLWETEIRARPINAMTVAVIGVGRIGSRVARIYRQGLGAKVIGYDIEPKAEYDDLLTYVDSLEEAIQDADIITLHTPLDASSHHMFDRETLAKVKPGVILVNTARGGLVDAEALIEAIDQGYIAQAAIDVYEHEAPYMPKDWRGRTIEDATFQAILDHPKIVYTPHIAYYTDVAVKNLVQGGLDATLEVIRTGDCQTRVK